MPEIAEYDLDETKPQSVTLDCGKERQLVEIYAKADVATDFYLDVSVDGQHWILAHKYATATTEWKEGFWNTYRFLRLRSKAAGSVGNKVTLILLSIGV